MAKAKKNGARASNQPSLLAFWGKQSRAPVEASKMPTNDDEKKRLEKTNSNDNNNCSKDKACAKRRRLDDTSVIDTPCSDPSPVFLEQFRRQAVTPDDMPSLPLRISSSQTCSNYTDKKGNGEQQSARNGTFVESLGDLPDKESLAHTQLSGKAGDVKEDHESSENEDTDRESSDEEEEEEEIEEANTVTIADNPEGLSDYELLRLRNIARNNERLKALGLISHVEDTTNRKSSGVRKVKRSQNRPNKKATPIAPPPTRRSTRLSKSNPSTTTTTTSNEVQQQDADAAPLVGQEVEDDVPEMYDVSPVVQYDMGWCQRSDGNNAANNWPRTGFNNNNNRPRLSKDECVSALVPSNHRLRPPPGLSHIYSLNFCGDDTNWLVGAGKSGIIALWNCHGDNAHKDEEYDDNMLYYSEPVLSWKAHSGRWISEAQFLHSNASAAAPSQLITAANDGIVCLWDLSQVSSATGNPKILQQSNKTSWHTSGIFTMDVNRTDSSTKIVTGSKDKTICLAQMGGEFSPIWRSDFHTKTVKCVKFRDHNVLASASDDGCVAVLDDRVDGGAPPSQILEGLHGGRPHSILFDPDNSHVFLTAGLDTVIQAWDLRFLKEQQPVFEYYGHIPITTRHCKRINHPAFYRPLEKNSQRFLLTGGEGSHALSMFLYSMDKTNSALSKTKRFSVHCRGTLPHDGDAGSIAIQGERVAVSVDGGEILMLDPASEKGHPASST